MYEGLGVAERRPVAPYSAGFPMAALRRGRGTCGEGEDEHLDGAAELEVDLLDVFMLQLTEV